MVGINDWIYPSTRVADAVRFRPASLDAFYELACDPWEDGEKTLEEVCSARSRPIQDLMRKLDSLEKPKAESDWEAQPAHHLIDYLTLEHRHLLHSDLPAFRSLLEIPLREASGGYLFGVLLESFHRFNAILRAHIQEEEEEIFPAILRNDYALRRASHPGGPKATARAASDPIRIASRLRKREDDLVLALEVWLQAWDMEEKIHSHPKAAEMAAQVMQGLERKIRAHCDLEKGRLYSIALRIENELADKAA